MKQIIKQNKFKSKEKITKIDVTGDTLTGRGGLALFVRYLSGINIYAILFEHFSGIRKSIKGVSVWNIFKQIFCFLYDGTSRHLVYFDQLKKDEGYAAVIENSSNKMLSSHQVKRFFRVKVNSRYKARLFSIVILPNHTVYPPFFKFRDL